MGFFRNYILPIATLSGTIIGAGIFALPYITLKAGIWVMLAYIVGLGLIAAAIHQFYGEVSLKTPDFKRLPGFARMHLGKKAAVVAYISTIIGATGSLLAYMIVGGEFLESLLAPLVGGSNLFYTGVYFLLGAGLIFFGIKAIAKVEFWALVLFFVSLLLILVKAFPALNFSGFNLGFDKAYLFFPYGAVLFSFWGASLVPEIEEMLGAKKKLMKQVITASVLVAAAVYIFFIFLILSITGSQTTESALTGIKNVLGNGVVSLGLLFGVLTTFTSFITIGLTLKKVFIFDLSVNKTHAFIITACLPFILFMMGLKSFIGVISVVGGVLLGIDGILILMMYKKIKPARKVVVYFLCAILFLGIAYELIYFINKII